MTAVGVFGVLLTFLAFAFFSPVKTNARLALFITMAIAHLATTYIYYKYVQTNNADTTLYYYDPYKFFENGFGLSTMFVIYLTQTLREIFGGSYLDYFFVYQAVGVWGLALLVRSLDEISLSLQAPLPPIVIALLFLPGMYFWTSAIGKDAPLFFATSLAVWSSLRISKRWPWLVVAVGIMILFRAHIALVTVIAFALALVSGRGVSTAARIALIICAATGAAFLFGVLQSELRTDLSSLGSIANFVEKQTTTASQGGDQAIVHSSFLFKLFSLLYRPLFVDADGVFGLVASLQNLVMIGITVIIIRNFRLCLELFHSSLPFRFVIMHFCTLAFMLTIAYYNIGLGLRQREMATPSLIVAFGTLYMVLQIRRSKPDHVPSS